MFGFFIDTMLKTGTSQASMAGSFQRPAQAICGFQFPGRKSASVSGGLMIFGMSFPG